MPLFRIKYKQELEIRLKKNQFVGNFETLSFCLELEQKYLFVCYF